MTETRKVGDVMTPNPVSIAESASLAEAAALLGSKEISGLPVVDASGSLVGVLSQTDLIRGAGEPGAFCELAGPARSARNHDQAGADHRLDRGPRRGRAADG